MADLLSGALAEPVVDAWKAMAIHFLKCPSCTACMGAIPDSMAAYDCLCETGRPLFVAWTEAKMVLVERWRELTSPYGIVGTGEEVEERAAALTALPEAARRDILFDKDDDRRESKIRAVIAAHRAGSVVQRAPQDPEERSCAFDGCTMGPYGSHGTFKVRFDRPRQRYCSEKCRSEDRRPRARLESTED